MRVLNVSGIFIFLVLSGFLSGCFTKEDIDRFVEEMFADAPHGMEQGPVERDF
jgi:hypothetical protein